MARSTTAAARPHLPVHEGPDAGELLDVALRRACVPLTARVLGTEPDRLLLAPPVDVLGAPSRLVPGELVDLVWSDGGDLVGIPVAVERTDGAQWSAVVVGPPQRVQRRDAVRVPLDARAVLSRPAAGEAGTAGGAADGLEVPVLDLSEGGARCLVDPVALQLEQGQTVLLRLPVDGLPGPVSALVVHRRFRGGTRHVDVGLRFTGLGEAEADALRRHVFARMRDLRRRGDL